MQPRRLPRRQACAFPRVGGFFDPERPGAGFLTRADVETGRAPGVPPAPALLEVLVGTQPKELIVKLLLVDGLTIFRMGLRALFSTPEAEFFSVVGECADGAQACPLAASLAVDVVVTELHLPDRNGIALARELGRGMPATRVLVLAPTRAGGDRASGAGRRRRRATS